MNNREYGEIVVKELQAALGAIDTEATEQFVKLHTVFFTVNKAAFSDTMKDKLF